MNIQFEATLRNYEQFLRFRNYCDSTINGYKNEVIKFLNNYKHKTPTDLSQKDLQEFMYNNKFTSTTQQNQSISSLKLYFRFILKQKLKKVILIRPRTEKKLPQVVNHEELIRIIESIYNLKHKTIISLAYATGLRVSEIRNLKIINIDSKRMMILVISGKGRKDRYVPFSQKLLVLLRNYYIQYKPTEYLFEGQKGGKYSIGSFQAIWRHYKTNKQSTFHTLRHSCFTNLLENGTDLVVIRDIAGHKRIETTQIYTHISDKILSRVNMPI